MEHVWHRPQEEQDEFIQNKQYRGTIRQIRIIEDYKQSLKQNEQIIR